MAENHKIVKVVVSIPTEGHTQVEAYANRLENFMHLGMLQQKGHSEKLPVRFEFCFVTLGRIFIPIAREEAANIAIDHGADYLYMIDDDMICPNSMFESLYAHNVDLVAPLAFTRKYPHKAVIYDVKQGWDSMVKEHYFKTHFLTDYPKEQLVECDAVGFGAVLIKTSILKKMQKPWFTCSSANGEDVLFCTKAKNIGFRIFMDTAVKLGHLSYPIEVTEAYVEKVRREYQFEDPTKVESRYTPGEAILVREQ